MFGAKISPRKVYATKHPALVLYNVNRAPHRLRQVGQAAMGPFYCPGDKMYLDLDSSKPYTRLNSPGEFAQAYVIAHEVGHHIQKLEGSSDKMDAMRRKVSENTQPALGTPRTASRLLCGRMGAPRQCR